MSVTRDRLKHTIILTDKQGTKLLTFQLALSLQKVTCDAFTCGVLILVKLQA